MIHLGLDIGSTTAKLVALDVYHTSVFTRYVRHNTRITETIVGLLKEFLEAHGDCVVRVAVTGTAGMGLAERAKLPFVQEVVATALVVQKLHPEVRTLVDIGGEDGKIIIFDASEVGGRVQLRPTIRMNGACAGGTGAFIDQMAGLLGVEVEQLSALSETSSRAYPMASRCGVFAKTDVQTLMSRNVPREDIVASVYRAVAFQTVSSLAHGADMHPKLMFIGGPLGFQPGLRKAFREVLGVKEEATIVPPQPELIPAQGAALYDQSQEIDLSRLIEMLAQSAGVKVSLTPTLPRLFESKEEFESWREDKSRGKVKRATIAQWKSEARSDGLFIGIDMGSRTSKIALVDADGRLLSSYYAGNDGDPLETVSRGLAQIGRELAEHGLGKDCVRLALSTGYGEDLLRSAYRLDGGIVETLAHFRAASSWDPQVSFILDIGGQDMKAIWVKDRVIEHIDLNEACSSGTGSFIEGFAMSLGHKVEDFALAACFADLPRDLGTRCTVFMNSKVKQALREGAQAGDISAGLSYSVIKNCFHKVLKVHDSAVLGTHVVAQGGTFKNPAVLRALEKHLGFSVTRPEIAELMGAYGAALVAIDRVKAGEAAATSRFIGFDHLEDAKAVEKKSLTCKGCENLCAVTRMKFANGSIHFTGNKCEKVFSNAGQHVAEEGADGALDPIAGNRPYNMVEERRALLFDRPMTPQGASRGRIGLPRVLNMFEDAPFWITLFVEAGFEVVLSDVSTPVLAEQGYRSVMSENVCFPAKIVHGHILNLIEKKVDRIFFPMVRYDRQEFKDGLNSYNCPVVTGYPQVIRSAINPDRHGVAFDHPPFSFKTDDLARAGCVAYLAGIGVDKAAARVAFQKANLAWFEFHRELATRGRKAREASKASGRLGILLLMRPYHADALINHRLPEMITALGADVFTDDLIGPEERGRLDEVRVLTQWAFPNRFYDAALWAASEEGIECVTLNSFGCGPDALTVDEVKSLLQAHGKNPTLIRVDEVSSPGSLRLRVRSLIDSIRLRGSDYRAQNLVRKDTPNFEELDKKRKIIAPMFAPFYTEFIVEGFKAQGYDMEILPMPDWQSVQCGLAFSNHDICYPATIVIGDLVKALQSGRYDPNNTAVAITQTGGQCRASSYASMLKRALVNAGFDMVPVVTLSTGAGQGGALNAQPGFKVGAAKLGLYGFFGIFFADILAKLFYATSVRENTPGAAWEKVEHWVQIGSKKMHEGAWKLLHLVPEIVQDFASVLADTDPLPKVGIVGEIYVKFNPFANNYVTEWLKTRKLEADVPPLINFFLQRFVTDEFNQKRHIDAPKPLLRAAMDVGEGIIYRYFNKVNRELELFPVALTPFHTMEHLAKGAERVLSLINQFGESWLIAGDIAGFMESGTRSVLCLQPFGCIANHVIAKGVEKQLKETYPELNLLFLDMDAGASEVNQANRLEFLARAAWEDFRAQSVAAEVV